MSSRIHEDAGCCAPATAGLLNTPQQADQQRRDRQVVHLGSQREGRIPGTPVSGFYDPVGIVGMSFLRYRRGCRSRDRVVGLIEAMDLL